MSLFRLSLIASAAVLFGAGCSLPTAEAPKNIESPSATAPADTTSEDTKPTTNETPTPTTKPKAVAPKVAPKPVARTSTVTIMNRAYSPMVLAITTGDTVVWTNKEAAPHTTVSDNALIWDSGNIPTGGSYKRVFSSPGTYTYHCGVHPDMKGTIIVRDPPIK